MRTQTRNDSTPKKSVVGCDHYLYDVLCSLPVPNTSAQARVPKQFA